MRRPLQSSLPGPNRLPWERTQVNAEPVCAVQPGTREIVSWELAQKYFIAAEIFEREQEQIFSKQWLLIGHESQIAKAGDYIDASAASVTGERANLIRLAKESSFHFNGAFSDKVHQVISVYYDDMIRSLVSALKDAFAWTSHAPAFNRPVPMVLSGGTALPKGFRDRFEKILGEQDFPVKVSEIRLAQNPLCSTAKGALICALSDS